VAKQAADSTTGAIPVASAPDRNSPPVARQMDGQVAVLTMQHAPHNFLSTALFTALIDAMGWAVEQKARAVLLRSGLRNFCAGQQPHDGSTRQGSYRVGPWPPPTSQTVP
jgi:hypothetical protein